MIQFILKEDLINFIKTLYIDHDVYYLAEKQDYAKFSENESSVKVNIDLVRAITPLKTFFFQDVEKVSLDKNKLKKKIIFGAKECDLQAKKILDQMFSDGICSDPFYKSNNENTIIFASDCPEPANSCWCSFVGGKPYSTKGFDVNFSPVGRGYLVESGSETGEKMLNQAQAFFKDVSEGQLSERDNLRKKSIEKLDEINKEIKSIKNIDFQKIYKDNFNSDKWKELSSKCVQCTGCNKICPSCYCFYLSDISRDNFEKIKFWDACHSTSYARVAGGANARPKVYERFRNRYQCKFNYRVTNFGMYACTGCGRCFDVAPCKIDIRKVTLELSR